MRILFVPMFRHPRGAGPAPASDSLGFGITCSDALVYGLRGLGGLGASVTVTQSAAGRRAAWIGEIIGHVENAAATGRYDVILAFHAFWPFTSDLRRALDDTAPLPLVTYTHGSHWDETDLFRFERYPRLGWADLGNLAAADRVLLVSEYMRDTIVRNVGTASPAAASELAPRLRVVGLPLDLRRIDAAYRTRDSDHPTIVYNHAPIAAKRPGVFLDVAESVLADTAANVLITRHMPPATPWAAKLTSLVQQFPNRVICGEDLPVDAYYAALWRSQVQVSTATHESLGVATLEAMATGNQCLLPRIGAYPEIAADDPAVLYSGVAELRDRLVRAAARPDAERASAHCARIRDAYSPKRVAAAVYAVLCEVA